PLGSASASPTRPTPTPPEASPTTKGSTTSSSRSGHLRESAPLLWDIPTSVGPCSSAAADRCSSPHWSPPRAAASTSALPPSKERRRCSPSFSASWRYWASRELLRTRSIPKRDPYPNAQGGRTMESAPASLQPAVRKGFQGAGEEGGR